MPIIDFSEEEKRILKKMIAEYTNPLLGSKPSPQEELTKRGTTVGYYIALPTAEIPALSYAGTSGGPDEGDTPGEGTADIYQQVPGQGLKLIKSGQTVYNYATTVVPVEWVAVAKDPWKWYIIRGGTGSSSSGSGGTGTCGPGIRDNLGNDIPWTSLLVTTTPDYVLAIENNCLKLLEVAYCPTGTAGTGTA